MISTLVFGPMAASNWPGVSLKPLASSPLFGPIEERRFPYEEELELEHAVQREGTTSLVASLPEAEREAVLERIREALQGFGEPVRFRCWTEVFVADAR